MDHLLTMINHCCTSWLKSTTHRSDQFGLGSDLDLTAAIANNNVGTSTTANEGWNGHNMQNATTAKRCQKYLIKPGVILALHPLQHKGG